MPHSRLAIRMKKLEPWLPAAMGAFAFLVGVGVAFRMVSFVLRSQAVAAAVVGSEVRDLPEDREKHRTMYRPVLEFADAQGRRHTFLGDVATGRPWSPGATVSIRYDRENPDDARMAAAWTWLLPALFIGLGAIIFLAGLHAARATATTRSPGLGG
jgi:hypothetical protein